MPLRVELHLDDVELPLGLVVLLAQAINLVLLRIELDPVSAFDVFLDLHTHDVCIDWQGHLVSHRVNLSLFLLNSPAHVIQSLLDRQLELFLRLNLLRQAFLKLGRLRAHLLIVTFEIRVQGIHLFFFGYGGLKVSFNGAQRPLQVVILLPELVEQTLLQRRGLLISLAHCHLLLLHVFCALD